jgi:DNA polymerase-3 subunit beta
MLFEIERDPLLEGLSRTVPITEKRSPLPILSHILMEARDGTLILTATDLEVGLRMTYDCSVSEPGTIAIPSKKFHEIVRELGSGLVKIRLTDGQRIQITSGHADFQLVGMDPVDYPAWSTVDEVQTASIQADKLLSMIDRTVFASSSDDSRFNLNGVLFEKDETKTRMVATDGHRLALTSEELDLPLENKVLVPKKGLQELKRLLDGLKGEVLIGFEQKNLIIRTPRLVMTIRLIDGEYPDYRKVIPESSDRIIKINRLNLLQGLRKAAILTSDRNKGINVDVSKNQIEVSATHPDLGTAKDVVDAEFEGDTFAFIVNVTYLIEALGVIDTDTLTMEYLKEGAPVILRPYPAKEYFNLVMPMRK